MIGIRELNKKIYGQGRTVVETIILIDSIIDPERTRYPNSTIAYTGYLINLETVIPVSHLPSWHHSSSMMERPYEPATGLRALTVLLDTRKSRSKVQQLIMPLPLQETAPRPHRLHK
jgi:hypothetical protein